MSNSKTSLTAKRIKTNPSFQRTRENMSEFGHAAQTGKLLRYAFAPWLDSIIHPRLSADLLKTLLSVIQSDTTNSRGQRNIINANLALLEQFEFNKKKQHLATAFPLTISKMKLKKYIGLSMRTVRQKDLFPAVPPYATHVKVHPVLVAINPGQKAVQSFYPSSAKPVSILEECIPQEAFTAEITIPFPAIVIVTLFVEFSNCVNYQYEAIRAEGRNSLTIIKAFIVNPKNQKP